jgi:uncharacterized protein YndB with AHSA1/START domain
MEKGLIAKITVTINAPVEKVWEALTTPALIKQYFFGTDTVSDWKVGSPLIFRGTWEGKPYEDKGIIQKIDPPSLLEFTYRTSFSQDADIPENYSLITYRLKPLNNGTELTVTQDKNATEERKQHMEENWGMILKNLKELLEK